MIFFLNNDSQDITLFDGHHQHNLTLTNAIKLIGVDLKFAIVSQLAIYNPFLSVNKTCVIEK